jgi:hypothetical protein
LMNAHLGSASCTVWLSLASTPTISTSPLTESICLSRSRKYTCALALPLGKIRQRRSNIL